LSVAREITRTGRRVRRAGGLRGTRFRSGVVAFGFAVAAVPALRMGIGTVAAPSENGEGSV